MTKKPDLSEIRKTVQKRVDWFARGDKSTTAIGKAFTEFYVRDIAYQFNGLTDPVKVDGGLECDGNNDFDVDFGYEFPDDNSFWICQSKFKKAGSLGRGDISSFFQIHARICDKSALKKAKKEVWELLENFSKQSSAVFVLLTNSEVSKGMRDEFDRQRKNLVKSSNWENFDWQLVGLPEIEHNLEKAQTMDDPPPSVDIPIASFGRVSSKITKSGKSYPTIVTAVNGADLCAIWEQHGRFLFNRNIRGFLGRNKKNKFIMKTLEKEPEFFYLYNNGISAICSSLSPPQSGGTTAHCEGFQIINGAQTVCSIGDFAKAESQKRDEDASHKLDNLQKVWVLVRITQTEADSEKELNINIIRYNNSQNVIRDADFCSNDKVQVFLQREFQRMQFKYCGGASPKTLVYKPKRMPSEGTKGSVVITMEDAAKSLFAFMQDEPDKLNSQSNFLFDESEHGSYQEIFGNDGKKEDTLPSDTVKRFAAIFALNHFLNLQFSKLKKETVKKGGKDEPKYPSDKVEGMMIRSSRHPLWAFGYMIRTHYAADADKIYDNILNGTAFAEGGFVPSLFKIVMAAMKSALKRDNSAGKTLNFKMWLRDNKKVQGLMDDLEDYHDFSPISINGRHVNASKPTKRGKLL